MTTLHESPPTPGVHAPGQVTIRTRFLSGRIPLRSVGVCTAGTAGVVLAFAWSLAVGDVPIPLPEVFAVLTGGGEGAHRFVITELRLPRAVVGLVVGAALGLAGALFQTFARNPLASPDVLGITDGAAVGAVLVIVMGSSGGVLATSASSFGVSLAALTGALATAGALYLLAWRRGVDGTRLVLIGVGLSAVMTAGVHWMLTKAAVYDLPAALVWLSGSLVGRGWPEIWPVIGALAVLGPLALALTTTLRALQLGDDTARGLGVRLQAAQLGVLLVAVGLAAFAVSAAGPIDFVAFVVPQIAIRLVGGSRPPLLASAILGSLLVLVADTVSRTFLPTELPVGVVTAVVGAPYLLWLLVRSHRKVSV